jgi:hypothetical protein
MTVTDAQLKSLILAEVNDTVSGPVGSQIDVLWAMYAAKALITNAPLLQYQYALKKGIEIMLGVRRSEAGKLSASGISVDTEAEIRALTAMLAQVSSDIADTEKLARAQRGGAIGRIARTAPITQYDDPRTVFSHDPNKRSTAGDPLLPIYRKGVW